MPKRPPPKRQLLSDDNRKHSVGFCLRGSTIKKLNAVWEFYPELTRSDMVETVLLKWLDQELLEFGLECERQEREELSSRQTNER